jgi:uncharacterized protein YdeI (YjbR/CyaY-like superfamily)
MKREDGVKTFHAVDRAVWRDWLEENHQKEKGLWLIIYKKKSQVPSVFYDEAVDEALCFGWIDSKPNKRDAESYFQYFSQRSPKSNWSKVNKDKIARLETEGKIHTSGYEMIRIAKEDGTWDALNDVENLIIPPDLATELQKYEHAKSNFENFPRSVKRGILEWIFNAKRPATREKRILETAALAEQNIRANQYNK